MDLDIREFEEVCRDLYVRALKILPPDIKAGFADLQRAETSATGRAILGGLDQRLLIGFQIPRLMGAVFLLGWAMGDIPWQFALPAGLGDIWAGVAAIQAVRAIDRGDADADRLLWRANIIGLSDFVVAVSIGVITTPGFLHLLAQDAPNIINTYPLALFPGYFVPIFIAFQLFSIGALRRGSQLAVPA